MTKYSLDHLQTARSSKLAAHHRAVAPTLKIKSSVSRSIPIAPSATEAFKLGAFYTPFLLASWVAHLFQACLNKNETSIVLDPACGDGALLEAVKQAFATQGGDCRLVGVDLDAEALNLTRERIPEMDTLCHADALAPCGRSRDALIQWRQFLRRAQIEQVDGIIANPPWGADIQLTRAQLQALGYKLAHGQFDSYDLFVEMSLRLGAPGAAFAFILPDSLFLPEHQALREMLLRETQLLLIARLGEGFFPGVFRGAVVVIFRNEIAAEKHAVKCLRLTKEWRLGILSGDKTFEEAEAALSHFVPQKRFGDDAFARFDIDAQTSETDVLEKVTQVAMAWTKWLASGRGVELSKHGQVMICPRCGFAFPLPRRAEPLHFFCKECGHTFPVAKASLQALTRKTAPHGKCDEEWLPFIVGEDVDRYSCHPSREIRLGVEGINYKTREIFAYRKLLVRKTGVGLKAAIDESGALTNQVVFHYYADPARAVPPFFLDYVQGVLSSRVMFAYHLKRTGENEWRSHPYVTQKVLSALPIPEIESEPRRWKQAEAIARAVRKRAKAARHNGKEDLQVECLVAGLYGLTPLECEWVARVLDQAEGLEPMRTLRLSDPRALKAVFSI